MPRFHLPKNPKVGNNRGKFSISWSQKQHSAGLQILTTKRGAKLPMTSYSRSRKNKAHAQRDSLGRIPPSSASRGRKRTPAAHGRSRVRLKRVLLNAYSMAELESWIKHHRNPGAQPTNPFPQRHGIPLLVHI